MTTPLEVEPGAAGEPEAILQGVARIEGRSLWRISWTRLKRDRIAMAGAVVVVLLILMAIFAPLIVKAFGDPPNEFHQDLIDTKNGTLAPLGTFGGIGWDHLMGLEPVNGRDIFSRVVYGSRISLLIAFFATLLSVAIGTTMGVVADSAFGLEGNTLRVVLLIFIVGFFNWPYIGRIIRGQTLSLREREYVDAARSLGARRPYILFTELLPNLLGPILVYATLLIPTNILFEAALSFLGVGIRPPTASWGGMLSDAVTFYTMPHFMLWPGLAIFVTVLSFNLFGDGLRDALDPRSR